MLGGEIFHHCHADEQNQHQDKGNRCGKMQVIGHILPLDGVADEEKLAVAQLLGDIEGADGGDEHHVHAGNHAGNAQRKDHAPQHRSAVAAQVPRRFQQTNVKLGQDRIDRKHHIGEIIVDHADDDRSLGTDDMDGLNADRTQNAVDDAGILQNCHPRIGSDQKVHPHGDHDERHHGFLRFFLALLHDRITYKFQG